MHVTIEDTGPILEAVAVGSYGDAWASKQPAAQALMKQRILDMFLPGLNMFLDQVNEQLDRERDALAKQQADEDHDLARLRERMSSLLTGVADALNGRAERDALTIWSWHDLPEKARDVVDAIAYPAQSEHEEPKTA